MTGPFKLAPLPWDDAALEPTISSRTLAASDLQSFAVRLAS